LDPAELVFLKAFFLPGCPLPPLAALVAPLDGIYALPVAAFFHPVIGRVAGFLHDLGVVVRVWGAKRLQELPVVAVGVVEQDRLPLAVAAEEPAVPQDNRRLSAAEAQDYNRLSWLELFP
jgi:hypothetical protein